jgi:hypothetical protein
MSDSVYKGTYCACEGFASIDAIQLDRACGKARAMVGTVHRKLAEMSGDVAIGLKHHFKLDVTAARGVGRVYQEKQIDAILSVFAKMDSDFKAGMTYVAGSLGAVGTTASMNPRVIKIHPPFFTLSPLDQATGLIHEHAHFASRLPGALNTISDRGWPFFKAYHELNPEVYRGLTTDKALKNADCYAYFAREVAEPGSYTWIGD